MKKKARSIQYTIRGIPDEVDHALREKALHRKVSLNEIVVDELVASTTGRRVRADFSDLVGRWSPDPAFDEVIEAPRQIDWERWK